MIHSIKPPFLNRLLTAAFIIVSTLLSMNAMAAEQQYEKPPALQASDVLSEKMQAGDSFKVKQQVHNDGVMNHYVVDTDYGQFQAYGDLALARLMREIHVMVQLDETSKTDVFAKAAMDSATGDLKTIGHLARHPVGTVKGLPGGVSRMFHKYNREAKKAADAVSDAVPGGSGDDGGDEDGGTTDQVTQAAENYALKWFGVSGAESRWYKKLEIDPYTRNQVLRGKVKSVAHVDAAAHFGMKFVPIPSIPGAGYLDKVNDAVWTMDPQELKAHNIKTLQDAGVDEKLIHKFMTNENLSPSQQTLTLSTLAEMKGVEGLQGMLQIAADADSVDVAEFNLANNLFLAAYHKSHKPVTKVFAGEPVPVALNKDNGLVIIVSADYTFWVEELSEAIGHMARKYSDMDVNSRELWLRGKASPRFQTELDDLGWKVRPQIQLTEEIKQQFIQPAEQ